MSSKNGHIKEFANMRLDTGRHVLSCDGSEVILPLKELELLSVLLQRPGELVTKDEILETVWADSFVDENNLSRHIYLLRKRLKDLGLDESLIETVPRRGYRFVGEVRDLGLTGDVVVERRATVQTLIEELPNGYSSGFTMQGRRVLMLVSSVIAVVVVAVVALFLWRGQSADTNASVLAAGTDGGESTLVTTDFGFKWEEAKALQLQSDGKIIVGGSVGENTFSCDFALARYHADGSIDRSFGRDGKVVTSIGDRADILYGLAIQPDGKIIAVGTTFTGPRERRFAVARYKADGSLDASFNGSGVVSFAVGESRMDTASKAVFLQNGKILVTGSALMPVSTDGTRLDQNDFAIVRLNSDGSLDRAGFGVNGKAFADFGLGSDVPYAVIVDNSDRIVVAGMSSATRQQDFGVARFLSDGRLDLSFGTGGKARTDFHGEDDVPWSLAIQPDGKLIVGGSAMRSGVPQFAVARYVDDGSLDDYFGSGGKTVRSLGESASVQKLAIGSDGMILLLGFSTINGSSGYGVVALKPDGSVNEGFGDKGLLRSSLPDQGILPAAAIHPNGYAVFAGSIVKSGDGAFCLSRIPIN